jgi:hypothetical protein
VFGLCGSFVEHRLEVLMHHAMKQRSAGLSRAVLRWHGRARGADVLLEVDRR